MTDATAGQASDGPSLRDALSSAFDSAEAVDSAPVTSSTEVADAGASEPSDATPSGEAGSASSPSAQAPDKAATGPDAGVVPAKPAADAPKMPPGFPGGADAWAALPDTTRAWVKGREQQVEKYIRTNAEAAKFGGSMWQAIKPFHQAIASTGAHPAQVVAAALNTQFALAQGSQADRAAVIQSLARQYGVPLTYGEDGQATVPQPNPEVQQLRHVVGGLVNHLRTQQQQQVEQQLAVASSQVNQFASESQRELVNEPRVANLMANLLEAGEVQTLDDAYDRAIWSFPDLRAVLMEQDAARRASEARTATHAAPARGGAPVAAVMQPNDESLRGTIERAFSANTSRRVA